ncbi:SCO family protein [Celeribacter halophilus]|jgi:protein SCO1/2|uniref:Protein SCO1/2 n=1 Tax=Celeribacter halophilus TaxID=576117 RepID=A0A1I3TUR2_9RHOB|nr:SCO family protein [Celeribacter halophilus]MDO6456885.1 SCO family protein [Celeribacter halophilus]MDO6723547.1 SCO family protein [Celeribacter halophilus]PZX10704.1 protein SCO1/2 [Celeribacter halophilus]SFJ73386.1 protein SCO1/2 [Celeribacter halophilus]
MSVKTIAISAGVVLVAVIGAGAWYATQSTGDDAFAQCRAAAVSGGTAAIGGPFELVNEDGVTVTDQDVFTKPTILYFGYTFCPDVCPLDNMRNADALRLLEERGYDAQTAFISIDPERDTPEVMKEFTSLFHEDMIGLTGTPEQVKAASTAYKTYYKKQDGDPEYYLVDHSTFTYLVFPEIGFVDFFKRDDTPEQMADRVACFIDAAG